MEKEDYIFMGFYIGAIAALLGVLVAISGEDGMTARLEKMKSVVEQCEKDLPRTQKCILTAIPEVK